MKRLNQEDLNNIPECIRPRFNELACFLTALVCVLALLTHSSSLFRFFVATPNPSFNPLQKNPQIVVGLIWMLLPLWNILTGFLMIDGIGLVDLRKVIADGDVGGCETFAGTALLLAAFFAADLGLKLPWNLTFSLCVSLASWLAFGLFKFRPLFNRLQPLLLAPPIDARKRHG